MPFLIKNLQIVENPSLTTRQSKTFPLLRTELSQSSQLTLYFRTLCKALRKKPLFSLKICFLKGLNARLMSQNEKWVLMTKLIVIQSYY